MRGIRAQGPQSVMAERAGRRGKVEGRLGFLLVVTRHLRKVLGPERPGDTRTVEWGRSACHVLARPRSEHGPSQGGASASSPRGCGIIIAGDSGHHGAWL